MLSLNYGMRTCKKGRGTRTVPSLSSENYDLVYAEKLRIIGILAYPKRIENIKTFGLIFGERLSVLSINLTLFDIETQN